MFNTSAPTTYTTEDGKTLPIPERMLLTTKEEPYPVIGLDLKPIGGTDDWEWQGFPIKTTMTKRLVSTWTLNPEYIVVDGKGLPTGQLYDFSSGKRTIVKEIVMTHNSTVFPTLEMSRAVDQQKRQQTIEQKLDELMKAIASGALVPAAKAKVKEEKSSTDIKPDADFKPDADTIFIILADDVTENDIKIERGPDNDINVFIKGALITYDVIPGKEISAEIRDKKLYLEGVTQKAARASNIIPLKVSKPEEKQPESGAINQDTQEVVNKVPPEEEKNFLQFLQINPDATEAQFMAYVAERDAKSAEQMQAFLKKA